MPLSGQDVAFPHGAIDQQRAGAILSGRFECQKAHGGNNRGNNEGGTTGETTRKSNQRSADFSYSKGFGVLDFTGPRPTTWLGNSSSMLSRK